MKRVDRIGTPRTHNGLTYICEEYENNENILVRFPDGSTRRMSWQSFNLGAFRGAKLKYNKYGGTVGYGKYFSNQHKKLHHAWRNMLKRAYGDGHPNYIGTTVCDEWYNFQVFATWYESQICNGDDWQVDKDILKKGNKHYCPEYCRLVPPAINGFFSGTWNRELPIGVQFRGGSYYAACHGVHLGCFKTPEEAAQVYAVAKEQRAKELAKTWDGLVCPDIISALYNWKYSPDK